MSWARSWCFWFGEREVEKGEFVSSKKNRKPNLKSLFHGPSNYLFQQLLSCQPDRERRPLRLEAGETAGGRRGEGGRGRGRGDAVAVFDEPIPVFLPLRLVLLLVWRALAIAPAIRAGS